MNISLQWNVSLLADKRAHIEYISELIKSIHMINKKFLKENTALQSRENFYEQIHLLI